MAASLPGLEVTGERIPTPKNWNRDECSEIIVQDPADENLYGTHDVETPYMVESWLKGIISSFHGQLVRNSYSEYLDIVRN